MSEKLSIIPFFCLNFNKTCLKGKLYHLFSRVLPDTEKLEFVRISVSWIQGQDIMDSCFVLNFGYQAPLPWPQVYSHVKLNLSADLMIFDLCIR